MCQTIEEGGLNMINVDDLQKSFLLTWATKLMTAKDEKWKHIPCEIMSLLSCRLMSKLGGNLCCFSSDQTVRQFKGSGLITNTFWKKVLLCWLHNKQKLLTDRPSHIEFNQQCLWNNSNILYKGKTLFLRDWIDAGFSFVKNIFENDSIMALETICDTIGNKPTRMFEYGAIPLI